MLDGNLISHITMVNWRALWQWYIAHLDIMPLLQGWRQGQSFGQDDYYTLVLFGINILAVFLLISLLIQVHRQSMFHTWLADKRARLANRLRHSRQSKLEAKVSSSRYLKQAYNLHRFAMYDPALAKYKMALQATPYDLNTYLLGIKIVAEMDEPNQKFCEFLQRALARLRNKEPAIWREVAKYGCEKTPTLMPW